MINFGNDFSLSCKRRDEWSFARFSAIFIRPSAWVFPNATPVEHEVSRHLVWKFPARRPARVLSLRCAAMRCEAAESNGSLSAQNFDIEMRW
jgi:hypothetical protein